MKLSLAGYYHTFFLWIGDVPGISRDQIQIILWHYHTKPSWTLDIDAHTLVWWWHSHKNTWCNIWHWIMELMYFLTYFNVSMATIATTSGCMANGCHWPRYIYHVTYMDITLCYITTDYTTHKCSWGRWFFFLIFKNKSGCRGQMRLFPGCGGHVQEKNQC